MQLQTSGAGTMLIEQVAALACGRGETANPTEINQLFAMVAGINPQEGIEGILAGQMAATHTLAMNSAERALLDGQAFEGHECLSEQDG